MKAFIVTTIILLLHSNLWGQKHQSHFECEYFEYANRTNNSIEIENTNVFSEIKIFKIAIATTGEFSSYFFDNDDTDILKVQKTHQAITSILSKLNQIFLKDIGVKFELIENNQVLYSLNSETDPYTSKNNFNTQLQNTLNTIIGSENYHLGHLLHFDSIISGNAGCIGCVCSDNQKGKAYSIIDDPESEFLINLMAHEIGHQLGAYHSQSSSNCSSGSNNSMIEPGSGSTIMSYAGFCYPNVQHRSDSYFNNHSKKEMLSYISNLSCYQSILSAQNNTSISCTDEVYLPANTPFYLKAQVINENYGQLYQWEQNDPEINSTNQVPNSSKVNGPIIRSFAPSPQKTRFIPNLIDLKNQEHEWEVLPSIERNLNFKLSSSYSTDDNFNYYEDNTLIHIHENAGPVEVTSQNSPNITYTLNNPIEITWSVNQTDQYPINNSSVDVLLSTDGGITYNYTIATQIPNSGYFQINTNNLPSTDNARIMIKGNQSPFFNINNYDFKIIGNSFYLETENNEIDTCINEQVEFNLNYFSSNSLLDSEVNINYIASSDHLNIALSKTHLNSDENNLTVSITNQSTEESNEWVDIIVSNNSNESSNVRLLINYHEYEDVIIQNPENEEIIATNSVNLEWLGNSSEYIIELASDINFNSIIQESSTTSNNFWIENLDFNNNYYWRVTPKNNCTEIETYKFTTPCSPITSYNNSNIMESRGLNYVNLKWKDENASNWELEYGTSSDFENNTTQTISTTEPQVFIENLSPGSKYECIISSICNGKTNSLHSFFETHYELCAVDLNEQSFNSESTIVYTFSNKNSEALSFNINYINCDFPYNYLGIFEGDYYTEDIVGLGGFSGIHFNSSNEVISSNADSISIAIQITDTSKRFEFDIDFECYSSKLLTNSNIDYPLNNFNVYPNPNNGNFSITNNNNEQLNLNIYSINGTLIKSIYVNNEASFKVENLNKGIYFIKEEESKIVKKIIVD